MWWILIYFFIAFAILFYAYGVWEAGYFKRKGIKNLPFDFPIIGNTYKTLTAQEHFMDAAYRIYNAFPGEKYVGVMQMNRPLIMIRDLELLKQVTIKEFDHFADHQTVMSEKVDPLFGNNLFQLRGEKWRNMRGTLSPAFTSTKMRSMFMLIDEISMQTTKFYLKKMTEPEWKERGLVEIELKDTFSRYANDVIATSAFGLNINSLDDRENEFYEMGKQATDFSGIQVIKLFMIAAFPNLMRFAGIKMFSNRVIQFFRSLVLNTMKNREEKNIVRPDMIHLLMQAKKGSLKHEASSTEKGDAGFATVEESNIGKQAIGTKWTDDQIVAQAVLFFSAGFDTVSTSLCFVFHELTVNPDVQKKLQNEIDELISEKGDTLNYEDLMKMKYMDMVISESLRLWPPGPVTNRDCLRSFELPPPNDSTDKGYTLKKGEAIWIPIHAIHHDPKYYPNPKKFDPERFSDENKANINPMAFLPFGHGPRNCIGSRFALMEVKSVVFHLLSKFNFVKTAKTDDPIQISKKTFAINAANGFWIGLQPRFT